MEHNASLPPLSPLLLGSLHMALLTLSFHLFSLSHLSLSLLLVSFYCPPHSLSLSLSFLLISLSLLLPLEVEDVL